MSYEMNTRLFGNDVSLSLSGPWTAYWIAFLRLITGYWLFHAGLSKYMAAEPFDATWWLMSSQDTIVGPVTFWFGQNAAWFVNFAIPAGQVLIGLGVMLGVLTRLAAFFGAFLMTFFYLGNADWAHGFVNSDLMGLLLFLTIIVLGAGRVYGGDAIIEKMGFAKNSRFARYILG